MLNGVKWHVTSYNTADYCFFQAKDRSERGAPSSTCSSWSTCRLPGCACVRTPAYSHTISHHHPIVGFADVRVPAASLVGAEGDGMSYSREWFRFERLMVAARCARRGRAPGRRDDRVRRRPGWPAACPIAEHGLVAGMLADSVTELFAARSMLYETARGIDRDRRT